ncbi:MAG: hypothetical protein Q4C76_03535 [Bacillota bacterium]|nr:hypothetical protein [Bacillota bacterium]
MIEILILALFIWLSIKAIGIALKLTWGAAKILASIVFVITLPVLVLCLLFASGIVLLLPVALIAIVLAILKSCS